MVTASKYPLDHIPQNQSSISPVAPKSAPALRQPWVVWEYTACLFTDGLTCTTRDLHDAIKAHAQNQNLPINIFYSPDASWIIEGAWGRAKVDDDRRPRISMTLKDSRYSDMQFITGIDYFGDCWANFQMMMVVQPEELERPLKPAIPNPILPNEAIVILVIIAGLLGISGNAGLQLLGAIGLIGGLSIWAISNQNVRDAKQRYEKWKEQIADLEREEEEIKRNRLSRSFKSDDLFVFHEVMTKITSAVISYKLIKQGAVVEDSKEQNFVEQFIPKSKKDIFEEF
jgi:hypothetical protein